MNSMPFRQLKSFLKILIGVQYDGIFPHVENTQKNEAGFVPNCRLTIWYRPCYNLTDKVRQPHTVASGNVEELWGKPSAAFCHQRLAAQARHFFGNFRNFRDFREKRRHL